jgi:putative membrane protein
MRIRSSVVALACLLATSAFAQNPPKDAPPIPEDRMEGERDVEHERGMKHDDMKKDEMGSKDDMSKPDRAAMRGDLDDGQLVRVLGLVHQTEMELAQMALDKSDDEQVKQLAQHILDDHKWLDQKTVDVVEEHDLQGKNSQVSRMLLKDGQKVKEQLGGLEGQAFDRVFLSSSVQMHRDVLGLLKAQSGGDFEEDIQQLIDQTLPSLQAHHDDSRTLMNQLDEGRAIGSQDRDLGDRPVRTGTERDMGEEDVRDRPVRTGTERDIGDEMEEDVDEIDREIDRELEDIEKIDDDSRDDY